MNYQEYIAKHKLKPWKTRYNNSSNISNTLPSFFVTETVKGQEQSFPHGEQVNIFANDEKTLFVAVNNTRNKFLIHHHEMIPITSEWQRADINYKLQEIFDF
jgi:hypothetical protein